MNRFFRDKYLLQRLTCLFWLVLKLISFKLWISNRYFPVIPAFDFLAVPDYAHIILYLSAILCLSFIITKPVNSRVYLLLLIIEILSCSLDLNRWQSWEYQFLFTLLIMIIYRNNERAFYSWLLVILATIYFYSGLQKFNPGFLASVWEKTMLNDFFHLPTHYFHNKYIVHAGFIIPVTEVVAAIGLLVKRWRKATILSLIIMHCVILAIIGPAGLNINAIVWPWNLLMILYLYFLLRSESYLLIDFRLLKAKGGLILLVAWCLLPLLNFFGYWDYYLSFSLYSGRTANMEICVDENLPREIDQFFYGRPACINCFGKKGVNIQAWSIKELSVPCYPELRVYKKIQTELRKKYPRMKARFYIYQLPKRDSNYVELR